ncbi:MAG: replicative DNA helicase [Clostridia bacterium]|nr:replicative DNA helicase [Clostridia bacterium]
MDNQSFTPGFDNIQMPYSIEAEQAVLGAVLFDQSCLNTLLEMLRPECFYVDEHREIFSAMNRLFKTGAPVDFVTVLNETVAVGAFSEDTGKKYLYNLTQAVPQIRNYEAYAKIIRDKFELRSLVNASREIIADAVDESNEASVVLDRAEQRIYEIAHLRASQGLVPISEVIMDAYDKLSILDSDRRDEMLGTPSGIKALDDMITGLNRSDLIILAARPGMGKTSFALNIARNVAINSHKKVAFFSLEMSREQLALRILSSESGVSGKKLRSGKFENGDWPALANAAVSLHAAPIYLDEKSNISVTEMKAKVRRLGDVELVVIDYLQLMSGSNVANRVQDISDITRSLKIMAKELNVTVICLSQLNRAADNRVGHRPALADLRDSGSIEQDADIVMFLFREGYYEKDDRKPGEEAPNVNKNQAICIVATNRHGEVGDVNLHWSGETTRFTALEERRDAN